MEIVSRPQDTREKIIEIPRQIEDRGQIVGRIGTTLPHGPWNKNFLGFLRILRKQVRSEKGSRNISVSRETAGEQQISHIPGETRLPLFFDKRAETTSRELTNSKPTDASISYLRDKAKPRGTKFTRTFVNWQRIENRINKFDLIELMCKMIANNHYFMPKEAMQK